ncbi:lipoate-protein ligase b [Nannochloropsis oceanica]
MNSVQASPDRLLLLQHPPTYTLGTGSTPTNLLFDPSDPSTAPAALFKTERGGEATWHGPGQLVAYPLLDLKHYRQDLHWYLRALEEVVIQTLAPLGIEGGREEGLTGVWVEGHKVAAVGVKVKRWVTMHGVALNVDPSMDYFKHIVPCGIGDRPVGSVMNFWKGESGKEVITVEEVALLMKRAFEDVFGVVLVDAEHSGEEN